MTRVVKQRTPSDCGLAALVTYQVDAAVRRIDPEMHGLDGLYNREIVAAAKLLGFDLRPSRRFNLDEDEGVLRIRWIDRERRAGSPDGHFVALIRGCVHCSSEQVVMPWREYFATYGCRAATLLRGSL